MWDVRSTRTRSVRYSYAVAGSGPPLVLLSGAGGWRLTFSGLGRELASHRQVIAVDPPGQGDTQIVDPTARFDADAVAHSLEDFLEAIRLSAVDLLGHSWGGGFALRLAQLHPDRVRRLVLLAPAGLDVADVWEFRALRIPLLGELLTRLAAPRSLRHMLVKSFAHPERIPWHRLAAATRAVRTETGAATFRRDVLRDERNVDWATTERSLAAVRCPTLVLWGDRDRYLPSHLVTRFAHGIPHVRTAVIAGCGHALHDDCPDRVLPHIHDFLDHT